MKKQFAISIHQVCSIRRAWSLCCQFVLQSKSRLQAFSWFHSPSLMLIPDKQAGFPEEREQGGYTSEDSGPGRERVWCESQWQEQTQAQIKS